MKAYRARTFKSRAKIDRECRTCGTLLPVIHGQKNKPIYCQRCKSPNSKERILSTCDNCGGLFEKAIRSKTRLCSSKCIGNYLFRNWVIIKCEYCGNEKRVTASYPSAKRFCSNECAHKAMPFPMNRGLSKYSNQEQKDQAKRKQHRSWYINARDQLTDYYVGSILSRRTRLSRKDFPSEIVEIKRKHITALRLITKKQTKCT